MSVTGRIGGSYRRQVASGKDLSQTSCNIFSTHCRNVLSSANQMNIYIHMIVELCLGPYLKGLTKSSEITNKISVDPFINTGKYLKAPCRSRDLLGDDTYPRKQKIWLLP